jgi:hypothetical protein
MQKMQFCCITIVNSTPQSAVEQDCSTADFFIHQADKYFFESVTASTNYLSLKANFAIKVEKSAFWVYIIYRVEIL